MFNNCRFSLGLLSKINVCLKTKTSKSKAKQHPGLNMDLHSELMPPALHEVSNLFWILLFNIETGLHGSPSDKNKSPTTGG